MRAVVLVWVAVLAGCVDTTSFRVDASLNDGGVSDGHVQNNVVAAPRLPHPVDFGECSSGFVGRVVEGTTEAMGHVCDLEARRECSSDEAHFVGATDCEPVTVNCSPDGWPEPKGEATSIISVLDTSGNRSRAHGMIVNSLADALKIATPGTEIRLRAGEHVLTASLTIPPGTIIRGACAATRLILGEHQLALRTGAAELFDMTLVGGNVALLVGPATALIAGGLIFQSPVSAAIDVRGSMTAESIKISGTSDTPEFPGTAIFVNRGGQATLSRVYLQDNQGFGVSAMTLDSAITVTDLAVMNMIPTTRLVPGASISLGVSIDASLTATRVLIDGGSWLGASVEGATAQMTLRDAVIRHIRTPDMLQSRGAIGVVYGQLIAERVLMDDNGRGLEINAAAGATLRDIWVEGAAPGDAGIPPMRVGVWVRNGSRATFERVGVLHSLDKSIGIESQMTLVTMTDVIVRDTLGLWQPAVPGHQQNTGYGLLCDGGSLSLERASFTDNAWICLGLTNAARATLTDVSIRDVHDDGVSHRHARGMLIMGGARATAERLQIENAGELGLGVMMDDSALTVTDLAVRGVRSSNCYPESCASGGGIGAGVYMGAELTLARFELAQNALAGFQAGLESNDNHWTARILVGAGMIRSNPIGLSVTGEENEVLRSFSDVVFDGNGRNINTAALPSPLLPD